MFKSKATSFMLSLFVIGFIISICINGLSGAANAVLSKVPGSELSCTVQSIEAVAGSANEFLIHTDGCSDAAAPGKVFSLTMDETMQKNFVEMGFQNGLPIGTTLNINYAGANVPGMDLIPHVTGFSEDPLNMMPY